MIYFDVISLFTNVPIDATTSIILKRFYERNETSTSFTRQQFKEFILLCKNGVHFTLCSEGYIQADDYQIILCPGNDMLATPIVL